MHSQKFKGNRACVEHVRARFCVCLSSGRRTNFLRELEESRNRTNTYRDCINTHHTHTYRHSLVRQFEQNIFGQRHIVDQKTKSNRFSPYLSNKISIDHSNYSNGCVCVCERERNTRRQSTISVCSMA